LKTLQNSQQQQIYKKVLQHEKCDSARE